MILSSGRSAKIVLGQSGGQLKRRATPALASLDRGGRVIHIGSFSKTISPTLRLGFLVAPISLLCRFAEVAACLWGRLGPSVQLAIAEFMREGHYLRHLRRTKRAYSAQRDALLECLQLHVKAASITRAGLAAPLREILRSSLRDHRALQVRVLC
jgi:GntR family transcriptional regulator / MocR family aminotransferase